MGYHFSKPSFNLSQFVKQYWAIEDCLPVGTNFIQRIVPNGLMDMMFYLGKRPIVLDKDKNLTENAILSGQQKGYYDLIVSEKISLFSVSFLPYGAKLFFDIPLNEFFDQNIPLKYLLKDKLVELESNLYESQSFEEKIQIVEKFLILQLRKSNKAYEFKRIAESIRLIDQSKGLINIGTLSSNACLSRKQYERVFLQYIGSSPKQFLRTIRFQNTLQEKQKNKNIQLTQLAYNCGYYDQSHMISDFKLLSGKTPSQYFLECDPSSDYFL